MVERRWYVFSGRVIVSLVKCSSVFEPTCRLQCTSVCCIRLTGSLVYCRGHNRLMVAHHCRTLGPRFNIVAMEVYLRKPRAREI